MITRVLVVAALAIVSWPLLTGCGCPYGACRPEKAQDAGTGDGTGTAIRQNLADVEIEVEGVGTVSDSGYILRGKIVSVSPVGGSLPVAETGQSISLRPYFPSGSPDLNDAAHRRMVDLAATPAGERIRCRIALDGRGTWRIVSAK